MLLLMRIGMKMNACLGRFLMSSLEIKVFSIACIDGKGRGGRDMQYTVLNLVTLLLTRICMKMLAWADILHEPDVEIKSY